MQNDYPQPPEDISMEYNQEREMIHKAKYSHSVNGQPRLESTLPNDIASDPEVLEIKLSGRSRVQFIRKVYGILFAQLSTTALWITIVAINQEFFLNFLTKRIELIMISVILNIATLITLCCSRQLARTVPINYILLSIFTTSFSYMTSLTTVMFEPADIMIAGILTAAMTAGLSLYALKTEIDYSEMSSFLWSLVLTLIFSVIMVLLLPSKLMQIVIGLLGACILSVYIIFDTQIIIGGRYAALSIDDYIFAAMMLYLDVMRLFLEILRLLGKSKRN